MIGERSRYCIVQHTPNLVTQERVNVAVFTWGVPGDPGPLLMAILQDWSRIELFAGRTLRNNKRHLGDFKSRCSGRKVEWESESQVRAIFGADWPPYFLLTKASGSILPPSEALEHLKKVMLIEPGNVVSTVRAKKSA